jgi:sulfur-oxidizing protein SoxY
MRKGCGGSLWVVWPGWVAVGSMGGVSSPDSRSPGPLSIPAEFVGRELLDYGEVRAEFSSMPHPNEPSRRLFLRGVLLTAAGMIGSGSLLDRKRLLAAQGTDPTDPEVPNAEVARILAEISGGKPIRRGHLSLDMPLVAEDGRIVPVIIESDLPMTAERYVKAVHLIVDHNPDAHLAAFHLTPEIGSVSISTRIKMKRTTWVRAIAATNTGEIWAAYARVQVTLNGCG